METNTIIAFTVTIIIGLAAVALCFLTYQKYLTIKVFQGEQITTNEGQILVTIDEYFRDDVSNDTVKYISKTIETELFKGADSEIEHLVKNLVHNDNIHKMKAKTKDSQFNYLGLQNSVGHLWNINLETCGGCKRGPISTKACCIWRPHIWGDVHNWQWVGSKDDNGCNPWIKDSPFKDEWPYTSNCDGGPGTFLTGGVDSCQPANPSDVPDAPSYGADGSDGWYENRDESIFGKNEHMRGYCKQKEVPISANPEETQVALSTIPRLSNENINVLFYPPESK